MLIVSTNNFNVQVGSHNDEIQCMEAKVENAVNQLEDLRFELEKSTAREEKLEYQIIEVFINHVVILVMFVLFS